jgi:hypothetical protein
VSRHGKRRKPRSGEPPEQSRPSPPADDEPGYWDRGADSNPHYTEPEWYRREGSRDEPGGFGQDQYQPEPPPADPPGWDAFAPSPRNDFPADDPYATGSYYGSDPYRYHDEQAPYGRHPEHEEEQPTAAFDPFLDRGGRGARAEPEPADRSGPEPSPWETSIGPLLGPGEQDEEEPGPTSRRDRRVQQRQKAKPKQQKPAKRPRSGRQPEPEQQAGSTARVRRPDPEPLETDDVKIVGIGTILWGVAFGGLYLIRDQLERDGRGWVVWSCLAGFGLGLLGLWYVTRRRNALVESTFAAEIAAAGKAPPGEVADRSQDVDPFSAPEDRYPGADDPDGRDDPRAELPAPGYQQGAGPDPYTGHWPPSQQQAPDEYDDPTPVTGEIIFDDPPRSYRPGEPPPSFRRAEPVYPPEDGYGRGWDGYDPYRSRDPGG